MAKETGTATDYLDLMVKLRDFLTTSVGSPSPYAVMRDTTPAGSPIVYPSPVTQEMIFEGDASNGGSPSRKWYFGIQSYETPGSSIFGWEIKGFTGFVDGSPVGSVAFADQPNASPSVYTPLQNTAMTYWFWANERRVIAVIKTGTAYQWMYAGFINTFATSNEYPYPIVIMGSSYTPDYAFNSNAIDFSTGSQPAGNSSETTSATSSLYLRFADGQWYAFKNGYQSGSAFFGIYRRIVWPLGGYSYTLYPTPSADTDSAATFLNLMCSATQGGTPSFTHIQTPGSPNDISPLYPLTLLMVDPSSQIVGELDGIFWVHNSGGLTAEDEIFDNSVSPEQRYLVFQNVHRTDPWTFMAVKDS